jgi:hypothetical protein
LQAKAAGNNAFPNDAPITKTGKLIFAEQWLILNLPD